MIKEVRSVVLAECKNRANHRKSQSASPPPCGGKLQNTDVMNVLWGLIYTRILDLAWGLSTSLRTLSKRFLNQMRDKLGYIFMAWSDSLRNNQFGNKEAFLDLGQGHFSGTLSLWSSVIVVWALFVCFCPFHLPRDPISESRALGLFHKSTFLHMQVFVPSCPLAWPTFWGHIWSKHMRMLSAHSWRPQKYPQNERTNERNDIWSIFDSNS